MKEDLFFCVRWEENGLKQAKCVYLSEIIKGMPYFNVRRLTERELRKKIEEFADRSIDIVFPNQEYLSGNVKGLSIDVKMGKPGKEKEALELMSLVPINGLPSNILTNTKPVLPVNKLKMPSFDELAKEKEALKSNFQSFMKKENRIEPMKPEGKLRVLPINEDLKKQLEEPEENGLSYKDIYNHIIENYDCSKIENSVLKKQINSVLHRTGLDLSVNKKVPESKLSEFIKRIELELVPKKTVTSEGNKEAVKNVLKESLPKTLATQQKDNLKVPQEKTLGFRDIYNYVLANYDCSKVKDSELKKQINQVFHKTGSGLMINQRLPEKNLSEFVERMGLGLVLNGESVSKTQNIEELKKDHLSIEELVKRLKEKEDYKNMKNVDIKKAIKNFLYKNNEDAYWGTRQNSVLEDRFAEFSERLLCEDFENPSTEEKNTLVKYDSKKEEKPVVAETKKLETVEVVNIKKYILRSVYDSLKNCGKQRQLYVLKNINLFNVNQIRAVNGIDPERFIYIENGKKKLVPSLRRRGTVYISQKLARKDSKERVVWAMFPDNLLLGAAFFDDHTAPKSKYNDSIDSNDLRDTIYENFIKKEKEFLDVSDLLVELEKKPGKTDEKEAKEEEKNSPIDRQEQIQAEDIVMDADKEQSDLEAEAFSEEKEKSQALMLKRRTLATKSKRGFLVSHKYKKTMQEKEEIMEEKRLEEAIEQMPEKRKRGRPKKVKDSAILPEVHTEKRKRGRPKKIIENKVSSPVVDKDKKATVVQTYEAPVKADMPDALKGKEIVFSYFDSMKAQYEQSLNLVVENISKSIKRLNDNQADVEVGKEVAQHLLDSYKEKEELENKLKELNSVYDLVKNLLVNTR